MTDSTDLADILPRDLTAGRNSRSNGDGAQATGIASMGTMENGFKKDATGRRTHASRTWCGKNGAKPWARYANC